MGDEIHQNWLICKECMKHAGHVHNWGGWMEQSWMIPKESRGQHHCQCHRRMAFECYTGCEVLGNPALLAEFLSAGVTHAT